MSAYSPLPVEPTMGAWRGHQVAHYHAGEGPPVLLVHSINAAASAFEMRGPFAQLPPTCSTHALDLLGFGRSDRPERRYSAEDYIALITDTLQQIGRPATLVANTLTASYAIAVAARTPALVHALVLACPTGITVLADPPGSSSALTYAFLRSPAGDLVFRGLATRPSINYFLTSMSYGSPERVTPEVMEGFYRAAQHPNARYAPICFVSGLLNYNVVADFGRLTMPVHLVWGRKARTVPLTTADDFLAINPRAKLTVFDDAALMVQDEVPQAFAALVHEVAHA